MDKQLPPAGERFRSNVRAKGAETPDLRMPSTFIKAGGHASCYKAQAGAVKLRLQRCDSPSGPSALEAAAIESNKATVKRRAKQGRLAAFQRNIQVRVKRASPAPSPADNKENNGARGRSKAPQPSPAASVDKQARRHLRELKNQIGAHLDAAGTIPTERLRRLMLTDSQFQQAVEAAVGPMVLSQEVFDQLFLEAAGWGPEQVLELLVKAQEMSARMAPPTGVAAREADLLDWARGRLASCMKKRGSSLSPGVLSGEPSSRSPMKLGQVIVVHKPKPDEDEEAGPEDLEQMIQQEMAEQSQFLFEIARQRELEEAKKAERKHQDVIRYLGAKHRQLMKKVAEHKICLAPMCVLASAAG